MNLPFTEEELKYVQDACHALEFEAKVPVFECVEVENDAISCAEGFTILKIAVERDSILGPVPVAKFIVSETVWTPATRWHPEEADYRDLGTVDSLAAAIKLMLLRSYEYKIDNVLEGMAMEAAYGKPVEEV